MTGDTTSLEPCDEDRPRQSLSQALEHAYYARDVEALRRIAQRAELEMTTLRRARKESTP